jgi:hypothetical protein
VATSGRTWLAPALVAVASLALVGLFDLRSPSALDDDWGYIYSVQQLVAGHGFRWVPTDSTVHLFQTLWGAVASLGHPTPQVLRLTNLPFSAVAALLVGLIARELRASPFWSAVAGAAILCTPLSLTVQASFMTDVSYLALLVAACWAGLRWWRGGLSPWWFVLLAVLAGLQRQHGVALIGAAIVAGLLAARARGPGSHDVAALASLAAAGLALLALPYAAGFATLVMRDRAASLSRLGPGSVGIPLLVFPAMLAWFSAPFVVAVMKRPGRLSRREWILAVALAALTTVLTWRSFQEQWRWMVKWTPFGVGPWTMLGPKPAVPGLAGYWFWYTLLVPVLLGAFIWLPRPWARGRPDGATVFLVLVAASQLALLVQTGSLDRYFLPVLAPLLPLLARQATRLEPPAEAMALATGLLALNVAVWGLGELDYLAWQRTAERVSLAAYSTVPPLEVASEYEVNVVYAALPYYERTGRFPQTGPQAQGLDDVVRFLEFGPAEPRLRVCFGQPDDPRPGESYGSLTKGRIVRSEGSC